MVIANRIVLCALLFAGCRRLPYERSNVPPLNAGGIHVSIHCIDSPITDVVRILNYKLRNEHGDMFTINLQGEKRWTGWTYELIDGTDPFVGGVDDERWVKLPLQPPVVSIDVENAPIIEVLEAIEKQHASIRVVYLETEVNIILLPPKQGIVPVRGELGSGGEGP